MSMIQANGVVIFGDGTSITTGNISCQSLNGEPTNLTQFTNDLGNYGAFLSFAGNANVYAGYEFENPNGTVNACGSGRGGIGHLTSGVWGLTWNGTYPGLAVYNCNCACNC